MKIPEEIKLKLNLKRQTVLVDEQKCLNNIDRFVNLSEQFNLKFRPHFKTHRSKDIAKLFKLKGVDAITVSSLEMANYFAENGWNDITVAIPVNLNEIDEINSLAERIKLNLVADNQFTIYELCQKVNYPVNLWIKIDTGYNRAGVRYDSIEEVKELAGTVKGKVNLEGLLAHNGCSYNYNSPKDILISHDTHIRKLLNLKRELDMPELEISIGDTPSCSLSYNFKGINEVRPGNFVFYDLMMLQKEVCNFEEVAMVLAAPVIGVYEDKLLVHGGAVHLSKDSLKIDNSSVYGKLCGISNNGFYELQQNIYITKLSQEHGTINYTGDADIKPGDFLTIIPVHSCLTAHNFSEYKSLNGKLFKAFV